MKFSEKGSLDGVFENRGLAQHIALGGIPAEAHRGLFLFLYFHIFLVILAREYLYFVSVDGS
jgi:hypothetical protein